MYESLESHGNYDTPWWRRKKVLLGIGVGTVVLIVCISIIVIATETSKKSDHSSLPPLVQLMTEANIKSHLQSLQDIADTHGGNRAALHGYNASAAFVIDQIKSKTNFSIEIQHFDFWYYWRMSDPILTQITPVNVSYAAYEDFTTLTYTCSGNVVGQVRAAGGGCQASEYTNFVAGEIAFVKRNQMDDCRIYQKVMTAASMGASAVIIWTDEDYGLFTRGLNITSPIPALSASFEWGTAMSFIMQKSNITLNIVTDTISTTANTFNIIVDTGMGDDTQTIIVGSHLDSVPTGPGINDNGSGASANLELALQFLNSNVSVKNRVKFAWWAAEEFGMLGSEAYVAHLNATNQLHKVALNINYDMEGSPNYITMLYNGTTAPDPRTHKTCEAISSLYQEYFHATNTPYELIELGGGSDYNSFMTVGIPVGGLSSGVEDMKTMEQRLLFGGLANTPCDPCYHSSCDTIDNVSMESVMITAKSAAYVLQSLAGADLKALK